MFKTHSLQFRKADESDLQSLLGLKVDSWMNTHHVSFLNMHDQKNFFESLEDNTQQPKKLLLIAQSNSDEQYSNAGMFYISNIDYFNRSADVSWGLYSAFRNKNIGKYLVMGGTNICFQILNLNRLNCEILETNFPSIKCAEYSNYVEEGVKRESVFKNGSYINSLIYGVIREDFKQIEKVCF